MAEINLKQAEADALIAMEKIRGDDALHEFPLKQSLIIPILSRDKRESFVLDLQPGRINFSKITFQNRGRQVVVLVRLDLGGPPHRNPDGEEVQCPHLHLYREGFGDKWAIPAPTNKFTALGDHWQSLHDFMRFCSIVEPPKFQQGLFL